MNKICVIARLALMKSYFLMRWLRSMTGIREAPYYLPTVDIGSRQSNRVSEPSIFNAQNDYNSIMKSIQFAKNFKSDAANQKSCFGQGGSNKMFLSLLEGDKIWFIKQQKQFQDIGYE